VGTECKIPSDGMVITFYEPISSEEKFEVGTGSESILIRILGRDFRRMNAEAGL